ncbi:MAG: hypothetical protein DMG21_10190 [Acidobacteria bacterium]|nr:MAG: hypothetical protein DMG21_10190 [Acidobacteriota bacterium]
MKKPGRNRVLLGCLAVAMVGGIRVERAWEPAPAYAAPRALVEAPRATVAPASVGLSPERLGRIVSAIQKAVDDGRIAGGVILVARHGKIAYLEPVGMADRETKTPHHKCRRDDAVRRRPVHAE